MSRITKIKNSPILALFLGISLCISWSGFTKTIIITDIDDTLKITHLKDLAQLPGAAIDTEKYFKGMPRLLKSIPKHKIFYVSNGLNTPFKNVYKKFLFKNEFPRGEMFLRKFSNLKTHKVDTISYILNRENPEKVIFIGDNGQEDPEIYHHIEEKFSSINFITFIRTVYNEEKGTPLESGQIGFVTPFEIVDRLFEQSLLSLSKSLDYIKKESIDFLTEGYSPKKEAWIPAWVNCEMINFEKPEKELSMALFSVYYKIEKRCFN